ncbi:MAG: S46 family peptidase [Bacteroidales bacterium]|nr:S46 family peptidase [Bacteroidales bacterium]
MTRKIKILLLALLMGFLPKLKADEGMWLPFLIDHLLHEKMQEMGLKLTPEQIFSINESSLKDAIVIFGGGCTGEIISDQGLLLTNHHCGYGRIQAHSSPENDILTDGFWAMTREEELPNPGLSVSFLVNVADVTEEVLAELNDDMNRQQRDAAIRRVSNRLVSEATEGTHLNANVRTMYAGNEFYLFVYERFNDVRMVGVPPSSIGKFGGDTDNWMWPRHTGDFALFRVYTAPDGTPADFSPENIPLQPRHHLPVSIRGVQEGDFAMVLGFPGSTDRYLTSMGINFKLENEFPIRIEIRRKKLDIIEGAMAQSDEIRIKYASKQSGISNYWKNFIGMSNALERLNVAETKKELEEEFTAWVEADAASLEEYGKVMSMFANAYEGYRGFHSHNFIFFEAILTGPDVIRTALGYRTLERLMREKAGQDEIQNEIDRLQASVERLYRNYDAGVDQKLWAAMMEIYSREVPSHLKPGIFNEVEKRFSGDFNRFASEVYSKSIFSNAANLEGFLAKPSLRKLQNDWVFRMAGAMFENHTGIQEQMAQYDEMVATANRFFIRGLREMDPERLFYPDANSTMRFTYGSVGGYHPADAVYYDFVTTTHGVIEKKDPDHHEFVVPEKLVQLIRDRDFGEYGNEETMIVNFIANNDITGGNSGSPVLDGEGNLIGLAFDGNWEAMSGDILFEQETQRCINVDARYILFIIDKFAGAHHLIEEITIVR